MNGIILPNKRTRERKGIKMVCVWVCSVLGSLHDMLGGERKTLIIIAQVGVKIEIGILWRSINAPSFPICVRQESLVGKPMLVRRGFSHEFIININMMCPS